MSGKTSSSPSLHRRVFVAGAWVVGLKGVTVLLTLIFNVLIARRLDLADVGVFLMIVSATYVAANIATLGVNSTLLRSLAADELSTHIVRMSSAWRIVGLSSALVGTIASLIAACLLEGETSRVVLLAALCGALVVIQALTLLLADCFRGMHDVRLAGLFDGTQGGLIPIAASTAILLPIQSAALNSLTGVLSLTAAVSLLNLLLGWGILSVRWSRRSEMSTPSPNEAMTPWATVWHSLPFLGTTLFLVMRTQVALWIVGAFGSKSDAAIFGLAQRVINAVMLPSMVMTNALQPTVAQLVASSRIELLENLLRRTATFTSLPVMASAIVVVVAGGPLLGKIFGPEYVAGAATLQILAVGNLAFVALGSPGLVLSMSGQQRTNMTLYGATVILTILIGVPVTHFFGMTGMAWAVGVTGILNKAVTMAVVRQRHGLWTHATLDFLPSSFRAAPRPQES
jgi:O-antigen/teichoic acid export membrane protein